MLRKRWAPAQSTIYPPPNSRVALIHFLTDDAIISCFCISTYSFQLLSTGRPSICVKWSFPGSRMSSGSAVEDVVTILEFLVRALICHASFSSAKNGSWSTMSHCDISRKRTSPTLPAIRHGYLAHYLWRMEGQAVVYTSHN